MEKFNVDNNITIKRKKLTKKQERSAYYYRSLKGKSKFSAFVLVIYTILVVLRLHLKGFLKYNF